MMALVLSLVLSTRKRYCLKFLWQEIINDHPHCPQIILHLKIVSELIFSVAVISVSLGADAGERFKMTTSFLEEGTIF